MPITATISISVTPLPDNDVWFANAAAWTNYWEDVTGDVTIDPVTNTIYNEVPYTDGAGPYVMDVDGVQFRLATEEMLNNLLAMVTALNDSYKTLRTELRNAGLLTDAQ